MNQSKEDLQEEFNKWWAEHFPNGSREDVAWLFALWKAKELEEKHNE